MRYYEPEHLSAYKEIGQRGLDQWNDLMAPNEGWSFDHFQNRGFLEQVLIRLNLPGGDRSRAFEYGCGTGPAACYLAASGITVDAIDLVPEAISIAQRMAAERGLRVNFSVGDITDLTDEACDTPYDMVVDSFCLQSVVTDLDREAVYLGVRNRLKRDGHYVISTALRSPGRTFGDDELYDEVTGILYAEVPRDASLDNVIEINGRRFAPHRRHLSPEALEAELAANGFAATDLSDLANGNVVCQIR